MEAFQWRSTSGHMWVQGGSGVVPGNALVTGRDKDGAKIYAGRAYHEKDLLPANVLANKKEASISYNGKEVLKSEFEILCGPPVAWQLANKGTIPPTSIPVGTTTKGEKLFIGRALYDGSMAPGKVHESHKTLYIAYGGKEVAIPEYEIMIYAP